MQKTQKAMKGAAKAKKAVAKEPKVAESRKPKASRPVEVDDDMIMTLEDDGDDVVPGEVEEEEEEVVVTEGGKVLKGGMSESFKFMLDDQSQYYEDAAVNQGWDFTAANKRPNTTKTTSLQAKIDALRKNRPDSDSDGDSDGGSDDASDEVGEEEGRGKKSSKRGEDNMIVTVEDELDDEEKREKARQADFFEEEGADSISAAKDVPTFHSLHLSRPLLRATTEMGFVVPTPIQARCIPIVMGGRDICAGAQTGSGKTAAFLLPTLERLLFRSRKQNASRVLVITPTRELATQCHQMCCKLMQYTDITACLVVGGLSIKAQEVDLRNKPDIVICTPGRMIDHVRNTQGVELDSIEVLILDEADRLLEMGFTEEVNELVKFCPHGRQTLLFSATMTDKVDELVKLSLNKPVRIRVHSADHVADRLTQEFIRIRENREEDREAIILALVTRSFKKECIIFFEEKTVAHRMAIIFGLFGLSAAELHGNMTQRQRLEALQAFKDGTVNYLLCTELAARGLDVKGCTTVINHFMPREMSRYIHRVGRTARAGRAGRAITLVGERGRPLLREIVKNAAANVKSRTVPVDIIQKWRRRLDEVKEDINKVYDAEREEKAIRLADMEATKATNMLVHADEIASRPARTWFQSQKEKEEVRKAALEALHIMDPLANDEDKKKKKYKEQDPRPKTEHSMTRKKRRRLEALRISAEGDGDDEGESKPKKRKLNDPDTMDKVAKKQLENDVKQKNSAKKFKREAIQYRNETGGDLMKEKLLKEKKEKKDKKKLKKKLSGGFDSEVVRGSSEGSGPKKSAVKSSEKSERSPLFNKDPKPKVKAKTGFKSKSRFKRR